MVSGKSDENVGAGCRRRILRGGVGGFGSASQDRKNYKISGHAKLNAYSLIFTFSKPCSEVTSLPTPSRRKTFKTALRCFLDLLKTAGVFPAYAGFQNG